MRPVSEQVVVITGASSGIGRETAQELAGRGASLVLAARNDAGLAQTAREVERRGGQAHVVVTDVADWGQVSRLADEAVRRFGRIDTWVNNAAVSEYATVEQLAVDEIDRMVQVNLLGTIYGVKAALPVMIRQGGGTIINVASVLGERAVPLQSIYCATKHGVKGFTEALRMELAHDRTGVNVTLILPAAINTPYYTQARSRMGVRPNIVPPVYEPGAVAEAILFAAEHYRRDIYIGSAAKTLAAAEKLSPWLMDQVMLMGGFMFKQQQSHRPDSGRPSNLFEPVRTPGEAEGEFTPRARPVSLYTRWFELHPARKGLLLAVAAGAVALLRRKQRPG